MTSEIPSDPQDVRSDSRGWAAAAHLVPLLFSSFIVLAFLVPLVIWLIKRDEDAYVEYHSREALNFQISILIYAIVSIILVFILIGILLLIALAIFALIFMIVAEVNAAQGKLYRYPLTIRFVSGPEPATMEE